MLKLYEINTEMREAQDLLEEWAAEHGGDITDFPLQEYMEKIQVDKEMKLLSIGCLVKDYEAEEEALEAEIKKLNDRKKAAGNKAGKLRAYAAFCMKPGEKVSDARVSLSWRKSKAVIVECAPESLPLEFQRCKVEPDKAALKEAMEKNQQVPGVRLEERQTLQIK